MDLYVENAQTILPISEQSIRPVVEAVLKIEGQSGHELSVSFLEPKEISRIHLEHFDDPSDTDCMSFPIDPEGANPRNLGQIVISPQTAINYCEEHGGEVYRELTLYLVHALLHLLGYRDKTDEEKAKMRLAEKRSMDYLEKERALIKK